MLRVLAIILALLSVSCMALAIVGMVTGRPSDRARWVLRVVAVGSFVAAVALNLAAH